MTKTDEALTHLKWLSRPHLLEKLSTARRIRLLCAPPGSGKSVLAQQFLQQRNAQPFFLLDLYNAESSVKQLQIQLARVLGLDEISAATVEKALLNSERITIVIDGYHVQKDTDRWLEGLFKISPPSVHWVVCTRNSPSWGIGHWLLSNELVLLEGEDLALSVAETSQLLSIFNMTREVCVEELHQQSGGWIAGICLHLLSMQSRLDKPVGLLHRNLMLQDYLDSEVLEDLTEEMVSLLASIAHAPFVDAPSCAFLGADPKMLHKLRSRHLFLHRLPGTIDRFVLAAPLRQILQERYPRKFLSLVDVCEEFYRVGAYMDAFRYALTTSDLPRALASISRIPVRELFVGENLKHMLKGVDQIGLDVIKKHHGVQEVVSRALLLSGRLEQTDQVVGWLAESDASLHLALSAELALHRGQAMQAKVDCHRTLDCLIENERWELAILSLSCLTRTYLVLGDAVSARHTQYQALELARRKGETALEVLAMLDEVLIEELAGNFPKALSILELIEQLPVPQTGFVLLQATALARRGWLLVLTGQENQAREALDEGMKLSLATRSPVASHIPTLLSQLDANNGEFSLALQRLTDIQRLMRSWDVSEVIYLAVFEVSRARVWVKANRYEEAYRVLSRLRDIYDGEHALTPPSGYPDLFSLLGFLLAEVLCAQGSLDKAAALLDKVKAQAEGATFNAIVCQAKHVLAKVEFQRGANESAARLQAAASAMALHQGQRNLLIGQQATDNELRLLPELNEYPLPSEDDLLSRRELMVLDLVAEGYSNVKIADILSISPYTVKTHARNIYSKLKVTSRTMAVARAKILGLLM